MSLRISASVCLLALGLTSIQATRSPVAIPDPITQWSEAASTAAAAAGMAPLRTPITLALLHVAMFDAVSAVTGDRRPHAVGPRAKIPL